MLALGSMGAAPARDGAPSDDNVELLAFGHIHNYTEGFFFPGTVPCEDFNCPVVPLTVEQGNDVRVTGLDEEAHQVTSLQKKGRGKSRRPLFQSELVGRGQSAIVETSKLEPGSYRFRCNVHPKMLGVLEVAG